MTERKTARVHRTPTGYLSIEAHRARKQYLRNRRIAWVVFGTEEFNGKLYSCEGWVYKPGTDKPWNIRFIYPIDSQLPRP